MVVRLLQWLAAALVCVALVTALAYSQREVLLTRLLKHQFTDFGFPNARLQIAQVDGQQTVIRDLRLVPAQSPVLRQARLEYVLADLLQGRLAASALHLDGLQLTLDLTGQGPLLGALQPLHERVYERFRNPEARARTTPALPIKQVTLRAGTVTVLTEAGRLTVQGAAHIQPAATGIGGTFKVTAHAHSLTWPQLQLQNVQLTWPGRLDWNGAVLQIELAAPGQFAIDAIQAAAVNSGTPLASAIGTAQLTFTSEGELRYSAVLEPDPTRWQIASQDAPAIRFDAHPVRIDVQGSGSLAGGLTGQISIAARSVALPSYQLRGNGLALTLWHGPQPTDLRAELALAQLSQTSKAPALPPLRIRGTLQRVDKAIRFDGQAQSDRPALAVPFDGQHDLASNSGELRLKTLSLNFGKTLQPVQLLPALAALQEVRGTAQASVRLSWRDGKLRQRASLTLRGIDLTTADSRVQGLNGKIDFNALQPPTTAAGQTLQAQRLTLAGIDLSNPSVRLQLSSSRKTGPSLLLEQASAQAFGGTLSLADSRWRFNAKQNDLTLTFTDLDLNAVLARLAIEGLSGTGRISGQLPLTLAGAAFSIRDGQLRNPDGGVIQFNSAAAQQALAGGGEQVELMLRALRDFRYQALALGVTVQPDGAAQLRLNMDGHNPAVLEGHPFRFNINLEGNAAPLLLALRQGAHISEDVLRRNWSLRR